MLKGLKLKIGGITISVTTDYPPQRFLNITDYEHFLTTSPPDINLKVHYGHIPKYKRNKVIFDSRGMWILYRSNNKYAFRIGYQTSSSFYTLRLGLFEPDFRTGDIYLRSKTLTHGLLFNPLTHPLDELIMLSFFSLGKGMLIHTCGINEQGKGILFVGPPFAGKSTLANLYLGNNKVSILSDDRIILRKQKGNFTIYGTPWHGEAGLCSPESAPLEAIFFLRHASKNSLRKIGKAEEASLLLTASLPTFWDAKGMQYTLGLCQEIADRIPGYELGFVPNKNVLGLIKNAL